MDVVNVISDDINQVADEAFTQAIMMYVIKIAYKYEAMATSTAFLVKHVTQSFQGIMI